MRPRTRVIGLLAVLGATACSGQISGSGGVIGLGASGSTGAGGSGSSSGVGGSGTTADCTPLAPIPRRLWRVSAEQYGNVVRDLLSLPVAPVLTNRGGEGAYAFFSDATLGVDQDFQYGLFQESEELLTTIAPNIMTLAPCSGTTAAAQTACAMSFAQSFGPKAFRRPLDPTEVTNLMKVYAQGAMEDYKTGIGLIIQALIISPSFVYRTELGPTTLAVDASGQPTDTMLTPYEIASQLGFMFLGSLPDAPLVAAADNGSLATPSVISAQIDRLLALPAVKANLTGIVVDWFNVRQMFEKTKDTSLFAGTGLSEADQDQPTLENDLLISAQQFVTDVLWTNTGKINDLVTSQKMFVNRRLATLYPGLTFADGPPSSNTQFVSATWPDTQNRIGMLSQPSFLWSASDPVLTSIVKRGKFIHDDIICQDPLPPPVDLTTPSALNVISCKSPDGTMTLSTCDSEILQSDARMTFQPCKSCHSQMDPYARVLQNFGPIGNYRTLDEAQRPLDTSVTFVPNSPLAPQMASGPTAFSQELIASGVLNGCSVQKMVSYAIGTMIQTYNTCEVQQVRNTIDGTIASLFRQVALANFTRVRAGGVQ